MVPPESDLARRLEEVARLVSGVAHDFNDVLFVISAQCQRLLDGLPEHPLRGSVLAIQEAAGRAAVLTNRLTTEVAAPPVAAQSPVERPRVLVVEDERPVRELLRTILARDGIDVRVATTAEEALQITASEEFDLLVTDVILPKMTGPDLARAVTARTPHTRVLLMSGYTGNLVVEDFHGGRGFIQKPFGAKAILERVRELLGRPRN